MSMRTSLEDLTSDGDTLELEDGRVLRLGIEADDINPFEDNPDFYGRIGWSKSNYYTGRSERPDDFDGSAEKLSIYNDVCWWQPPKDVARMRQTNPEAFRSFRDLVRDLASFGSHYVKLEVLQGEDAYHRPIVVNVAGLGGVDSIESQYVREVVSELASELDIEVAA